MIKIIIYIYFFFNQNFGFSKKGYFSKHNYKFHYVNGRPSFSQSSNCNCDNSLWQMYYFTWKLEYKFILQKSPNKRKTQHNVFLTFEKTNLLENRS